MFRLYTKAICLLLFVLCISLKAISQNQIEGNVYENDGITPLFGATIVNLTNKDGDTVKPIGTTTNSNGYFKIQAKPGDILKISFIGFMEVHYRCPEKFITPISISLGIDKSALEEQQLAAAVSSRSAWVGAKVGYNFDGFSDDNYFVGAAKIEINPFEHTWGKDGGFSGSIIGNIANFISTDNYPEKAETENKNLQKLTQSTQGMFLGLGITHEKLINENESLYFRQYATIGYRLNTYKKVGIDSSTVNLSQLRTSVGLELEGFRFKNNGVINLSIEGSLSLFDKDRYNAVFHESKTILPSLEATIILPLSDKIGLFANGTYAPNMRAVYLIGLIVNTTKAKSKK